MNRPTHFEYHTTDPAKTQAFFSNVFGWKITKWDGPWDYWLVETGECDEGSDAGINGGLFTSRDGQPRTVNTISVTNVDAVVEKIVAAGGTICVPKMAIPGVGWLAYATEPTGNLFGIMQEDAAAK